MWARLEKEHSGVDAIDHPGLANATTALRFDEDLQSAKA